MAGTDCTQTNRIIKKWEGSREILQWLEMTGLEPVGLLKMGEMNCNFIMAGNDRTQTNGIIEKWVGQWIIIIIGNDMTEIKEIIEKWEGDREVL